MTIRLNITEAELTSFTKEIRQKVEDARPKVQADMALKFQECVLDNFGESGPFRTIPWVKLSPAYAKKVGRTYATLEVSGALKSNVLLSADGSPDHMAVEADNAMIPYSTVHQYGGGNNIPARPYFPITEDGEVIESVNMIVTDAARLALQEALT